MKKHLKILIIVIIILNALVLIGCEQEYKIIGKEIIDGKVSATQKGVERHCRGCIDDYPIIWVQDAKQTKRVEIPFELENRWKVGDSCLLIIEKHLKLE